MKTNLLIILTLTFFPILIKAQVYERSKTFSEQYSVTHETNLQITNKYGDIYIIPWSEDSVAMTFNVMVRDKKEEEVERLLGSIQTSVVNTPRYLTINTNIIDPKTSRQADWLIITDGLLNPTREVKIDYMMYVPAWMTLSIDNKYGNIYLGDHDGALRIVQSSGDLKAGRLNGDCQLNLAFVNANIQHIAGGTLECNSSEVRSRSCGNLSIKSKSSEVFINSAGKVQLDSKRDKLYIDTLISADGRTDFTTLQVMQLKIGIGLTTFYGDVYIDYLPATFTYVNLNAEYTDIRINYARTCSYKLGMTYRKTMVSLPSNDLPKTLINEKEQSYTVEGRIGSDAASIAYIQLSSTGGSIFLQASPR